MFDDREYSDSMRGDETDGVDFLLKSTHAKSQARDILDAANRFMIVAVVPHDEESEQWLTLIGGMHTGDLAHLGLRFGMILQELVEVCIDAEDDQGTPGATD
ncbi:MAG: hypothetical protein AMJ55_00255 [Gammaproteobacteria bacterium SG8_15]|nr:MAG: hypothetical protein AMJ55_00255 [Gammaproteobacteria bacterium SG8_15]